MALNAITHFISNFRVSVKRVAYRQLYHKPYATNLGDDRYMIAIVSLPALDYDHVG